MTFYHKKKRAAHLPLPHKITPRTVPPNTDTFLPGLFLAIYHNPSPLGILLLLTHRLHYLHHPSYAVFPQTLSHKAETSFPSTDYIYSLCYPNNTYNGISLLNNCTASYTFCTPYSDASNVRLPFSASPTVYFLLDALALIFSSSIILGVNPGS